jgi:hypothetical protein
MKYSCNEIGCSFETDIIDDMIIHFLQSEMTEKDKETILQAIIDILY